MAEEMLKIRAHHLLCVPRYYSKGYDKKFAKNHMKICREMRKNPDMKIMIVKKLDDLCAKCPFNGGKVCIRMPDSNKFVLWLDDQVLKRLKIKENSVHTAKDAFNISMNKIPYIKTICDKEYCKMYYKSCANGTGINNSFKTDLNNNQNGRRTKEN